MRGRKKKENSLNQCFSIKLTSKQKETLNKNEWMKKELANYIRDYINSYQM